MGEEDVGGAAVPPKRAVPQLEWRMELGRYTAQGRQHGWYEYDFNSLGFQPLVFSPPETFAKLWFLVPSGVLGFRFFIAPENHLPSSFL